MKTEGRGNAGLMDNEENQKQVSLVIHSLGNRCAIPTFPPPRLFFPNLPQDQPGKPSRCAVEKWKSTNTIPTFAPHRQPAAQGSRLCLGRSRFEQPRTTNLIPKGGLAADRFAPAFRLILQLENATALRNSPYLADPGRIELTGRYVSCITIAVRKLLTFALGYYKVLEFSF